MLMNFDLLVISLVLMSVLPAVGQEYALQQDHTDLVNISNEYFGQIGDAIRTLKSDVQILKNGTGNTAGEINVINSTNVIVPAGKTDGKTINVVDSRNVNTGGNGVSNGSIVMNYGDMIGALIIGVIMNTGSYNVLIKFGFEQVLVS